MCPNSKIAKKWRITPPYCVPVMINFIHEDEDTAGDPDLENISWYCTFIFVSN